jgi:Heterokaryon incompatibility protein (HET)
VVQFYECATSVVGWLGSEEDDSGLAMRTPEKLNERLERVRAGLEEFDIENFYGTGRGSNNPRAWEPFFLLMRRPWWSRMWIVLEVTAKEEKFRLLRFERSFLLSSSFKKLSKRLGFSRPVKASTKQLGILL